jgi:hypothetical protein
MERCEIAPAEQTRTIGHGWFLGHKDSLINILIILSIILKKKS